MASMIFLDYSKIRLNIAYFMAQIGRGIKYYVVIEFIPKTM